jgi:hypothetical protein
MEHLYPPFCGEIIRTTYICRFLSSFLKNRDKKNYLNFYYSLTNMPHES